MIGKFVCPNCVNDTELKNFIECNASEYECSYCGASVDDETEENEANPISVEVDDLIEYIEQKLETDYDDPGNCLPYESREGGWQASTVWVTYELFIDELGGFPTSNDELIEDILDGIGTTREWCQRDPFVLSAKEALTFAWHEFCKKIKHETRFLFFDLDKRKDDDEFRSIRPSEMLNEIGNLIKKYRLVADLPKGTLFYRGRITDASYPLKTAGELGPPPRDKSQVNRMNAAGIPVFYGADAIETCKAELDCKSGTVVSIGEFELLDDCTVIDLTNLPEYCSIYADVDQETRASISFLYRFVTDAVKPVSRDGQEHIEYVPTQVVTEYFRYRFRHADSDGNRKSILGVRYPSSKRCGGTNTVLFITQSHCEGVKKELLFPEKKWLKLNSSKTIHGK